MTKVQTMPIETGRLNPQASLEETPSPPTPLPREREGNPNHASSAPGPEVSQDAPPAGPLLTVEQLQDLQKRIIDALCSCYDPEIPVNIYELGLIYNVEMATNGAVKIRMTLTSPACPVAGTLPGDVQRKIQGLEGVASAKVELVWEPPWDKHLMSDAAKLQLGIEDF